jgi:hypothetical protein
MALIGGQIAQTLFYSQILTCTMSVNQIQDRFMKSTHVVFFLPTTKETFD